MTATAQKVDARMRAVIVDDEPAAREVVRAMLAERGDVDVAGEAGDGREAVDVIRRARPDVVFLDVQMPDADGFEVLDLLGADTPAGVVFVTAHDEHAIRAFDVHALDYVLKPFGRPRFNVAVDRALERIRGNRVAADLSATIQSASERLRVGVRTGTKVTLVDVDAIDWIEADGDYARIHTGRQSYLVTQRMQALEARLERAGFVRAHRSVLVRADRVRELHRDADGGGFLVLADGVRLRVARGRWDDLTRRLRLDAF